jgi:hypothetical protein
MIHPSAATIGAILAAAIGAGARAQPGDAARGPLPAGALLVQVAEIADPSGFGRPMTAARILVPSGWRTEGGVRWATRPCQEPATFAWTATAPDGLSGVVLYPAETWAAGSSGPGDCMPGDYQNVRAYLEANIQKSVRGARVLDYRARADLLETNKDYFDGMIRMVNQSGTGMRAWADAGEILYAFEHDGTQMRGVASTAAMFYASELANPLGGAPLWTRTGGSFGVFSAFAPNGQLDLARTEAIRTSIKPDVAWTRELFKLKERIGEANVRATRERAALIVASGAALTQATIESNQMATRNYADVGGAGGSSTSATDDRIHRERLEVLRGVETYHDPVEGGSVQLDNTYDHAWRVSDQNAYILTNDPNFNPGLYDIEAQKLQAVQ